MSKVNPQELREAGKYMLAALVILYLLVSGLESQKVLWTKTWSQTSSNVRCGMERCDCLRRTSYLEGSLRDADQISKQPTTEISVVGSYLFHR
jgi:hypothetical protein